MADSNNAGAGAPPAGAANGAANNSSSASAGTNNQQQMVPITALHEERDKRQALSAEVEQLKQQMAALTAGNGNNQGAPNPNNIGAGVQHEPNQFMQELDDLWRDNPRKAMQTELMMAVNWRDQVDATVDDQFDQASQKYKDFNDHQSEVRKYIRKLPVEQRAKPGMIEAAYFMVKGRNADAQAKAEAERLLKKAQAGDGTQTINAGASSGGGDGQTQSTLTPDQKAAAAALGISEADYAKHMKR